MQLSCFYLVTLLIFHFCMGEPGNMRLVYFLYEHFTMKYMYRSTALVIQSHQYVCHLGAPTNQQMVV